MTPNPLFAHCWGGWGNRIGCMLAHLIVARRFCAHRPLYVSMQVEHGLRDNCRDCDFAQSFMPVPGVTVFGFDLERLDALCVNRSTLCPVVEGPIGQNRTPRASGGGTAACHTTGPQTVPFLLWPTNPLGYIVPLYVGDVIAAFQSLRPRAHIAKPVAEMSRRWRLREFGVGVHVRRTDLKANAQNGDDERQLREMAAALEREPRTVFYLAADNAASQRQFEDAFPGRVHHYMQLEDHPNWQRQSNETVALIDMFTLAECRSLILSSGSTFGRMAESLQCARSNGTVGRWCEGRPPEARLAPNSAMARPAYEQYERQLLRAP